MPTGGFLRSTTVGGLNPPPPQFCVQPGGGKTFNSHDVEIVLEPEVTVTIALLLPAEAYVLSTVWVVPDNPSVPLHVYAYVPVPPEAVAAHCTDSPVRIDAGLTEQLAENDGIEILVTLVSQVAVTLLEPEVITTVACLFPTVVYDFTTELRSEQLAENDGIEILVTLVSQVAVTLLEPEVITTVACLFPTVVYDFTTEL